MSVKWNLKNFEIFAHRGYYGSNTIESFQAAVDHGYHVESDIVCTADGTVFMEHDRTIQDGEGNTINVSSATDAQFRAAKPNQPTFTEFCEFMVANPDTLAYFDPYGGLDIALPIAKQYGIVDRLMVSTNSLTGWTQTLKDYPELSYNFTAPSTITGEADLDPLCTGQNIVSVSGGNEERKFHRCFHWYQLNASNVGDAIAAGATWFCPNANNANLDAFAEKLKEYTAPGYKQADMFTEIADAIRGHTGETEEIYARNFASQVRKLKTVAEEYKATVINYTAIGNIIPNLRGFTDAETIILDMNKYASGGIPTPAYMAMGGVNGGKIIYKNFVTPYPGKLGDLLRNANNVAEVVFEGGIYPTGLNQVGNYFGAYDAATKAGFPHNCEGCTVRGIHLDNIVDGGFSNIGGNTGENRLNILWEGTLYANGCSLNSGATSFTPESVNALVSCLADYSLGETHTLTLGAKHLAKVTDENKALAAARNWTLA